ncbi:MULTISPECIES: hypothetical protein [unclassified Clostridium]|uniref:hypothetical protein n=1 Tax=unclassified Clostridium TaxID=2614128 RepID=UPI0025BCA99F|nr:MULTISPECIES: hypothetical protein [unclassified Clostridium]
MKKFKEKPNNNFYEYREFYQVVEFYVKEGETIPKKFDVIDIEEHDDVCSIKRKIEVLEIVKKEIKYDSLFLTAKCKEIL